MSIRITQRTMYSDMVGQMQKSLANYMESVEQGSTQKKINRPSDDPAGTYRVLTTRDDINATTQYQENVDTARGWLELADSVLSTSVTTAIQGLVSLAEQASTGTYTASQRQIMADQARQYFGQLLNLSNTEFEGKSIFAGHCYDANAFEEGLALTSWDENWSDVIANGQYSISGKSSSTVIVQFLADDVIENEPAYRWTTDGGETWNAGEYDPNNPGTLLMDGVTLSVAAGTQVTAADTSLDEDGVGARNGTLLYIRPTAVYMGDDNDPPIDITKMGLDDALPVSASGEYGKNVLVRMDSAVDLDVAGEFTWSYSTDGGSNWITARGQTAGNGALRLPIPGGYVDIGDGSGGAIEAGGQIIVHPSRADLDYEIMKDTYLSVNSVGKDVFGGYYEGKPALDGDNNLFEVVGAFIGYLEGNNQEGCQQTLAALTVAEEQILAEATRIGGKETRLDMAEDVLSFQKIDQQERLSYVEDIDLTELLTKLTRQQLTYQTVLQSSSMIMQMSLANYI